MAYEEPKYKLIKSTDVYEIRQYQDRLAVETTQSQSQNGAFRRLFNYISGSNESSSKIAMTGRYSEFFLRLALILSWIYPERNRGKY